MEKKRKWRLKNLQISNFNFDQEKTIFQQQN